MAMLTRIHSASMPDMVPMYVLMSTFHLAPWLKLLRRRVDHAPV
jgi:hypothetical protein